MVRRSNSVVGHNHYLGTSNRLMGKNNICPSYRSWRMRIYLPMPSDVTVTAFGRRDMQMVHFSTTVDKTNSTTEL